jgi:hypothetical protein
MILKPCESFALVADLRKIAKVSKMVADLIERHDTAFLLTRAAAEHMEQQASQQFLQSLHSSRSLRSRMRQSLPAT